MNYQKTTGYWWDTKMKELSGNKDKTNQLRCLLREFAKKQILARKYCASGLSFCLKIQIEGVKSAIWLFVGYKWYTGGIQVVHTKM